jgi:hypothetical protein
LAAFAEMGLVGEAAKAAGCSRRSHVKWMALCPDYAAAFAETRETALECYESEARRRAVEGVQEVVLYKGKPVLLDPKTHKYDNVHGVPVVRRRYSHTLLIVLLKSLAPEKYRDFRDGVDQRATGDADLGEVRMKEFLKAHNDNRNGHRDVRA